MCPHELPSQPAVTLTKQLKYKKDLYYSTSNLIFDNSFLSFYSVFSILYSFLYCWTLLHYVLFCILFYHVFYHVASQQGTLTLPGTWIRPPFWDLLMLQLLRPNSSNLPCLYSTFHLEYASILDFTYYILSILFCSLFQLYDRIENRSCPILFYLANFFFYSILLCILPYLVNRQR